MTNQEQIIAPSLKLVHQWADMLSSRSDHAVFSLATQWGADQELNACVKWLDDYSCLNVNTQLRAARRPKPPSKAESALNALEHILRHSQTDHGANTIRLALERLKELEALPND